MLGSVTSTLSVLYCLFLLSIFSVPSITGLILSKEKLDAHGYDTDGVLEFVQIYLAAGSIVFLLYLLLGLTRPSRSALNDTGHTSAFVRVGGFVFGAGSVAYLALRRIEDYYNPDCSTTTAKVIRCLSLTVTMLQMAAVILCSRIKIDQPGLGRSSLWLHAHRRNQPRHLGYDRLQRIRARCAFGRRYQGV